MKYFVKCIGNIGGKVYKLVMEYRLNDYNHAILKKLIEDLKRVSKASGKDYIPRSDYEKNGCYSATPFIRNYGTWIRALEKAGVNTVRPANDYKKMLD